MCVIWCVYVSMLSRCVIARIIAPGVAVSHVFDWKARENRTPLLLGFTHARICFDDFCIQAGLYISFIISFLLLCLVIFLLSFMSGLYLFAGLKAGGVG